jgi:FkbM family methyltransferase
LRTNASPYPNIRVLQAALWDRDGQVQLFDPGSGHHGFQVQANTRTDRNGSVQAFRVDTLMQQMGWSSLDLLKIDIEGAEREVFEDSPRWMGVVNACMAELHDHLKPGCSASFGRAVAGFEGRAVKGEAIVVWRAKDASQGTVS